MPTIPDSYQFETLSGNETYRAYTSKLGDGIEQSQRAGLNPSRQEWQVTFIKMTQAEAITLRNIIRSASGVDVIFWKPPLETVAFKWKIRSHTVNVQSGFIINISCKMEQVY